MEPWRLYRRVVAGSHRCHEKDLDSNLSEKSDPDPHLSEKMDPDLH
jgi:hypothetical protein